MELGFQRTLTSGTTGTSRARHDFSDWLTEQGAEPAVVQDWAVVFSELVHNACVAAPDGTDVLVEADASGPMTLKVTNTSNDTVPTVRRRVAPEEIAGRGLLIVRELTDRLDIEVSQARVEITCVKASMSD